MLSLSPAIRIFVHALPTDMRKSFDGLYAIVTQAFEKNVLGGDYFVFVNRSRNRCKILKRSRLMSSSSSETQSVDSTNPNDANASSGKSEGRHGFRRFRCPRSSSILG